jgi:hypothetical protein
VTGRTVGPTTVEGRTTAFSKVFEDQACAAEGGALIASTGEDDTLSVGSQERGALLRREGLYSSG